MAFSFPFSILHLNFQKLTIHQRESYRPFLDKSLWLCLKGLDPWGVSSGEIFGVAAIDERGVPIGLAIGVYYRYNCLAQLLSLRTTASDIKEEVNEQLFKTLINTLRDQNCTLLTHTMSLLATDASQLESLFRRYGGVPQLFMVRLHFDLQAFNPLWFSRYQRVELSSENEILPWKELSSSECKRLRELQDQGRFSASVSPFFEARTRDPNISLAARTENEIIGWIIVHRITKDTVRFSSFYIERDFRTSKIPGFLLVRSIVLAQQAKIPKAIFEFNLEQVSQQWIDFVKKRLAPYAEQTERIYEVAIALGKREG